VFLRVFLRRHRERAIAAEGRARGVLLRRHRERAIAAFSLPCLPGRYMSTSTMTATTTVSSAGVVHLAVP